MISVSFLIYPLYCYIFSNRLTFVLIFTFRDSDGSLFYDVFDSFKNSGAGDFLGNSPITQKISPSLYELSMIRAEITIEELSNFYFCSNSYESALTSAKA